ncbi:hypothetical protein S245_007310, partial [Arachis hypogaea]
GEESDEKQSFSSKNKFSSRNASSKYDFVKVKVRLGDNADHYYVLSRFSLSRCGWMIMLQCGFDLENGQCWFIWNSFVRNWKFEPSPNIVTTEQSVICSLGLLSQLSYLWLSKNNLSGQIPPLVTNLTGLSFLHVLYSSMKLCNTFTSSISQVQFHNLIFFEGTCHLIISVVSLQKFWQKVTWVKKFSLNIKKTGKGVLPKNEKGSKDGWSYYYDEVVCAICNTEQPIGKQQIHCDECEICRVGGQENYFHCKKC